MRSDHKLVVKGLSYLYHKFGGLLIRPRLSAHEVADALFRAGLIEYVSYIERGGEMVPTHYRPKAGLYEFPDIEFRSQIQGILREYCLDVLGVVAHPQYILINDVEVQDLYEWGGWVWAHELARSERSALGFSDYSKFRKVSVSGDINTSRLIVPAGGLSAVALRGPLALGLSFTIHADDKFVLSNFNRFDRLRLLEEITSLYPFDEYLESLRDYTYE